MIEYLKRPVPRPMQFAFAERVCRPLALHFGKPAAFRSPFETLQPGAHGQDKSLFLAVHNGIGNIADSLDHKGFLVRIVVGMQMRGSHFKQDPRQFDIDEWHSQFERVKHAEGVGVGK